MKCTKYLVDNINHQILSLVPGLSKGLVGHTMPAPSLPQVVIFYFISLIYKEC